MNTGDPAQQFPGGVETQPTLEAVITRIDRLGALVPERFDSIVRRLDKMDVRLDRIAAEVKETHAELYALRAEWKEFRAGVKETT